MKWRVEVRTDEGAWVSPRPAVPFRLRDDAEAQAQRIREMPNGVRAADVKVAPVAPTGDQINAIAAELLELAALFVGIGWTQGLNARRDTGEGVAPEHYDANCWCAQGALCIAARRIGLYELAAHDSDPVFRTARDSLEAEIAARDPSLDPEEVALIPAWNDLERQTAGNVKTTIAAAAQRLRGTAGIEATRQ